MHQTWQEFNGISQIFTGTHLPARCVPLGPHTAPLTPHCCHRSLNSLSHTSLHSHHSNTVNISTVAMLGFWLCQFNTGSLAFGLCLSSTTGFFVWLLKLNISSLCYVWRSLSLELHRCCVPI